MPDSMVKSITAGGGRLLIAERGSSALKNVELDAGSENSKNKDSVESLLDWDKESLSLDSSDESNSPCSCSCC